jgi:hypothetical protein
MAESLLDALEGSLRIFEKHIPGRGCIGDSTGSIAHAADRAFSFCIVDLLAVARRSGCRFG